LFGWDDPGAAFTAVIQIGTESAVIIYFRRDILGILSTWTRSLIRPELRADPRARMGWYVIVGTIPIGILGFIFADQIETAARDLRLIATTLIALGLVLWLAERVGSRVRPLTELTLRDGILYGLGQACALIPGVSRSGATISTGLFLGYTREAATRYAFLLAIPAVLASGLFEALDIGAGDAPAWGPTILATIISFLVGYAVIAWLIRYVATNSFLPFVVYRVTLGLVVFLLLGLGVLEPTPS
jgi:undecaprenyl-diphosphatase